MCGISGFNWGSKEGIDLMVEALNHRGPDARGVYIDGQISLGHNRLSIIDLSSEANQPMFDNKDELVVVYNGEIYNFLELKKELSGEYEFKTKSDTEVILAGYRKWGKEVVKKLNGMFAFAIYDKRDGSLFCARDHAGIKPFYYFWDGKRFIFASEIKAILIHGVDKKINRDALNHYFRVLYVPSPMTMIENIFKLAPSHTLFFKDGQVLIETYNNYDIEKSPQSYKSSVLKVRGRIIKTVEAELVSDVPVGVYLSGGIDSSAVLFSALQFQSKINAFSIGFDLRVDEEREKFNQDLELAKRTATYFGVKHHTLFISAKDALNSFEETITHNSDLVSNPTSIAMFLLAKFAREKVKVVLSGNGADEIFGGYVRYKTALLANYYKFLPSFVRHFGDYHKKLAKLNYKKEIDLFAQFMFEKDERLERVLNKKFFQEGDIIKNFYQEGYLKNAFDNPADFLMKIDKKSWLPDYFFSLSDRMSMAGSLEERSPMINQNIVSLANSLPTSYKVSLLQTKKVLKDAFRDDLPDFLFRQPKRGWFSPGAKWLRDKDFSLFAKEALNKNYYDGTEDLFDWSGVSEMLRKHQTKEKYNLTILWAILSFQVWARKFKARL